MNNFANEVRAIINSAATGALTIDHKSAKHLLEISEYMVDDRHEVYEPALLHSWLIFTGRKSFMKALGEAEYLLRWSEVAFKFIQLSEFSFNDLLRYRADEFPQKVLFMDMSTSVTKRLSYEQVWRRTKEIAAAFYNSVRERPKVAILCENSSESALCDLACLAWDIPVSPLNVHFSNDELSDILLRMGYNIIVTDSTERIKAIESICSKMLEKPKIFHINESAANQINYDYLPKYAKTFSHEEIEKTLKKRRKFAIDEVCTIMFTSGSTGRPKGVSFSNYNLVSKRFARAAALPDVGENEVLLCFLPLFHTFGRYLEMMGMIYWGGTYVFAGNPSAETLLALFPKVNPTGFISVPIRWVQLYERAMEETEKLTKNSEIRKALRTVVGANLRWGLSAAGYLDPKIFQFFQKYEIELASGFGMTEATGGITMTPPSHYVAGTVGKPLPGVKASFGANSELLISGHYVARYSDDKTFGDTIDFPTGTDSDFKMPTGDVFKVNQAGYFEIIDRVKDIYKNNKGQTVSPRNVEMKFEGVPGFKRSFLAGDGKAYNTLLIVPDYDDQLFSEQDLKANPRKYYQKIVLAANHTLAPYERVVNFAILDRDFSLDNGELTPKGSFNRKAIEKNFADTINDLYKSETISIDFKGLELKIPRWFFRDLSILEDDIIVQDHGLINIENNMLLTITHLDGNHFKIGDLIYQITGNVIDLGILALQPKLWVGNPQLINFAPVKENWDYRLKNIEPIVHCDFLSHTNYSEDAYKSVRGIKNFRLVEVNRSICNTLFQEDSIALESLDSLQKLFNEADEKTCDLIRLRLQTLAYHPSEDVRCFAYRMVLQDDELTESSKVLPAFLESGLSFLNEKSIEIIARSNFERRRLNALRKRLLVYREQLEWPQNETLHRQMESIFRLLVDFVKLHPEYYAPVRVELANWVLHKDDPQLSAIAERYFWRLSCEYEDSLEAKSRAIFPEEWLSRIIFEDILSKSEINQIKQVLIGTTFLKQSLALAFDEYEFDLNEIAEEGIWISKINSINQTQVYRISLNTIQGKHFDMQLVLNDNMQDIENLETILWLVVVAGYPHGPNVLPKLGCARPELEARSMVFMGDLTVWERLRQISATRMLGQPLPKLNILKRLYTEGIAAFFRAFRNSGEKIIPGAVTPANVVVSDLDFRDGATILSLAGWNRFESPKSLVVPIINNFYRKAIHHYAWVRAHLSLNWIFDAIIEGLEEEKAFKFLNELLLELESADIFCDGKSIKALLKDYLKGAKEVYYHPLPLTYAIDKFHEWQNQNPNAIPAAKEQSIIELYNLYRLERYPEIARYQLYRHTYFAYKGYYIRNRFDALLAVMNHDRSVPATQLVELSDLQAVIEDKSDRDVFSKMVFPKISKNAAFDLMKFNRKKKELVVVSTIKDKFGESYTFREPNEPAEIGQLYRLFYKEKFSKTISEFDQFIILFDSKDRIMGGITYQIKEDNACILDGIVLASQLRGRGIGRAIMEDFINRLISFGVDIVKTTFFVDDFYSKLGFSVDKRWGLLVKVLNKDKFSDSI